MATTTTTTATTTFTTTMLLVVSSQFKLLSFSFSYFVSNVQWLIIRVFKSG